MNKILLAINGVLILAVAILFYLYLGIKPNGSAVDNENKKETKIESPKIFTDPSKLANAKIAFVNIDTLTEKYQYIIDKNKSFKTKQISLESNYKSRMMKFQEEVAAFQESVQAGIKPEAELMKEKTRLENEQMNIANIEKQMQKMAEEIAIEQEKMLMNVSEFVSKYNNGKYDYILSYSANVNSVLYAKPDLEITKDLLEGLNEEYKLSKK